MILIKNFYAFISYMTDSGLQCNKYNSYWYGVQYQDRHTALGSWYGPVEMILPEPELGQYHFHHDPWSVCISWYCPPYISKYYINIISWHDCYLSLWYVCTEEQRRKLLIYIAIFGRFRLSTMTTKQCLCIVVFPWFLSMLWLCTLYKLKPNIIRDIFINRLMLI
jgi:hypothetical protein